MSVRPRGGVEISPISFSRDSDLLHLDQSSSQSPFRSPRVPHSSRFAPLGITNVLGPGRQGGGGVIVKVRIQHTDELENELGNHPDASHVDMNSIGLPFLSPLIAAQLSSVSLFSPFSPLQASGTVCA